MTNKEELTRCVDGLREIAEKTVCDCTFLKETCYFGKPAEGNVLLPSGDEKYISFWVRDAAMMAESGLVPNEDLKRYIEIIATCGQNGEQSLHLANGLIVPPFAVADHINYDGKPVFFPGTYRSGEDQGDGSYGFYPPFCDNYYFVIMAGQYLHQSGDWAILNRTYGGMPLTDRLEKAFAGYQIDPETELCVSNPDRYTVDWGFVDGVKKTGKLMMASCLRYHAAQILQQIFPDSAYYAGIIKTLQESILQTFYDENTGWFWSATDLCRQHDVWATAYAVFLGITREPKTLSALAEGYRNQTAVVHGYVRHLLTCEDHSDDTAWESTIAEYGTYQNGGYWATPTGWYGYALFLHDGSINIFEDFLQHTQTYRHMGAPFEWIDADTANFSGLRYGTSGVLPYIGAKEIQYG